MNLNSNWQSFYPRLFNSEHDWDLIKYLLNIKTSLTISWVIWCVQRLFRLLLLVNQSRINWDTIRTDRPISMRDWKEIEISWGVWRRHLFELGSSAHINFYNKICHFNLCFEIGLHSKSIASIEMAINFISFGTDQWRSLSRPANKVTEASQIWAM